MSDFRPRSTSDVMIKVLVGFGAFWGTVIPIIGVAVGVRELASGDALYPVRVIALLVVMVVLLVLRALVVISLIQRVARLDVGDAPIRRQVLASRLSWIVAFLSIAGFGVIGVVVPLTPLDFVISALAIAGAVVVTWRLVRRMR